ncbi:MAG: vitamin B12 dependent-methionine synthase activation domain-containing protein, partial [Bacteroidota bacterium]
NIVGVVLACNNYDVIDLGVMVPADKILDAALEQGVDMIGLSGLITPSLDEMVYVAREMERRGMKIPLLIGGATTSRVHTAVKIAPRYSGAVVHVNDASRSVPVASALLSMEQSPAFILKTADEYARLRDQHALGQQESKFISLAEARSNRFPADWSLVPKEQPRTMGVQVLNNVPLSEIAKCIDWTPFFHAWEMKGSYPRILSDPERGEEARKLFADAQHMLSQIVEGEWLQPRAVFGVFPANAVGDDILFFGDEERKDPVVVLHTLRQQTRKPAGEFNIALSDFVAPKDSGISDYVGLFALSTGHGINSKLQEFEAQHDDYASIMLKALADRLAEAFAEYLHREVRTRFWAYAADESLDGEALIREEYQGIRPAPGYPAQPDHNEKYSIWSLLQVEKNTGIELTESLAMVPTAAVCGLYLAHPQAKYFGLGRIRKDQVEDYARRKNMPMPDAEKWLGPALGYEVE